MKRIEVSLLDPKEINSAEKMTVLAARLTQRGEKISNLEDFKEWQEKEYTPELVDALSDLPHATIRQFGMINVIVVGASRRFLAQITRRRVGVTFMSASLQYSDYSERVTMYDFVVPYGIIKRGEQHKYLIDCVAAMEEYKDLIKSGVDNDSAGYLAPQSLRNVLLISATPQAWIEMIQQRVCRRNTDETRFVMLKIWQELIQHSAMFNTCAPKCCIERGMSCGKPLTSKLPSLILAEDFPELA
jgi:thymidylate synthase (FAD)